jgi:hypothetical protein
MSQPTEKLRSGLDKAKAIDRFEDREYSDILGKPVWNESEGRFLSPEEKLSLIAKGIDAAKPHFRKPRKLTKEALTERSTPEPLEQITLEDPESFNIEDVLAYSGRKRFNLYRNVRNAWLERLEEETGRIGDYENLLKKEKGRDELVRITNSIGLTLEQEKIQAWRRTPSKLFRYFPNSGTLVPIPQYRRLCFLPLVAALKRRKYVDAMDAYLKENRFCRMYVLTSGERVVDRPCIAPNPNGDVFEHVPNGRLRCRKRTTPKRFKKRCTFVEFVPQLEKRRIASGIKQSTTLRERIRSFHREISKFSHDLRKRWGIEIVMRATEMGTPDHVPKYGNKSEFHNHPSPDMEDGVLTRNKRKEVEFHVHAHLLVNQHRFIEPDDFRKMLSWVSKRWPYYWHECGIIRNSREVCKYITKPAEVDNLKPSELVALFHATHRLKLIQPMGEIKEQMRRRRENMLRLESYEDKYGQVRWREVPDMNRITFAQKPEEPKPGETPSAEFREYMQRRRLEIDRVEERPSGSEEPLRVLAKCAPSFAPGSQLKEASVVVMGNAWDKAAVDSHPAVQAIVAASKDAWQAGLALAESINVHVDHPTVPEKAWVLNGSHFCREEYFDDPPPTTEIFDFYTECVPV